MNAKRIQADGANLRIKQVRSVAGQKQNMRDTLRSLGLRKPSDVVERKADAATAGMINTVSHLVEVEEAE